MEFEWDEAKRATNLAKHGLDFVDAITIWRAPVIDPISERVVDDEWRATAIGIAGEDEIIVALVYTWRGDTMRIISARRARRHERATYQDEFGRGR